jgi:zinc transport system substrate-binding protein
MARWLFFTVIQFLFLASFQCSRQSVALDAIPVFVSIAPQKYFIDKIGGSFVRTSVMVAPGASPHSYEPRPSQMTALSKAKAYFSMGLEFEKVWLPRFCRLNTGLTVISMDSGVPKKSIDLKEENSKASGQEAGEHNHHEGMDPHIWLSPKLVKMQAKTICEALCRLDPRHDSAYIAHWKAFETEITTIQDSIRTILNGRNSVVSRKPFMVFHPSWGYFADEFGLRQIAIEIEGKEPSAKQLQTIIETAKSNNVHTIFVQPQFSQRSAQIIARQLGVSIEIADDLSIDWGNNLIHFAKAVAHSDAN